MRLRVIRVFIAIAISCAAAWAQSAGTVQGEVTDQQGASIPGVTIQLTDPATNTVLTAVTNTAGRYIVSNVPPAKYKISFSKTGFNSREIEQQDIQVGIISTVNAALQVGQVTNVIEVTSSGVDLQTVNATVGTTVSGESLTYLPIFGSDASSLAIISRCFPQRGYRRRMYDQNTFQLDGGNNSNDMDGSMTDYTGSYGHSAFAGQGNPPSGLLPTPVDTIEEFKVSTAGQTADFNGASGSQIQMVTKRGTNSVHGSAYYYYNSSDVGGANTWDNNHTPSGDLGYTPIPITHNNKYGFTVGGPMTPKFWGGKTYFFFGYEGFNYPQSAIVNKSVPTDLLRAGVIQINEGGTYVPFNINPTAVTVNGVTYQPATCGAGACDPLGLGLNSQVSALWNKYMPEPNNTNLGDGHNVEGFQGQISLPEKTKFLVGPRRPRFRRKVALHEQLSLLCPAAGH